MTVKELIEELQKHDTNKIVKICTDIAEYDEVTDVDIEYDEDNNEDVVVLYY